MSFATLRQQLLVEFQRQNFRSFWEAGELLKDNNNGRNPNINRLYFIVPNDYNLQLTVNFPGYKTSLNRLNNLVYDYRVDLNSIPISHVNIIVDLYNKAVQAPNIINSLLDLLIRLAYAGDDCNINNSIYINNLLINPPSQNLLQSISQTHRRLRKTFQQRGNENWNYSIEQLATLIPLIVLQEDINYPMPRYEGRRMAFYRYLEAIYCAQNTSEHDIEEVIERALSHQRPQLWQNHINYKQITDLANL